MLLISVYTLRMLGRRLVSWLLIGVGIAGTLVAVLSISRAGIGWDAPVDIRAYQETYSVHNEMDLDAAYSTVLSTSEFYGILIPQLAEVAHSLITGNTPSFEAWTISTYRWQAGVTVFLAVVSAASLASAVGIAFSSLLAGSFTWALIMTTPTYVGMTHVNFKDVPLAAGLSLLSAGLMVTFSSGKQVGRTILGWLFMSLGAVLALGVRPGSWPLVIAIGVGSSVIFAAACFRRVHVRHIVSPVVGLAVASFIAAGVLVATNPFARINLFQWLLDSFSVMRNYPWDGVTRVAGQDFLASDLPWWYVPAWLTAQLPILTLLALSLSLIAILGSLAGRPWALPRHALVPLAPAAIQGIALPLVIIVSGSVLYDGLRHVLFMLPALAVLASVGVVTVERSDHFLGTGKGIAVGVVLTLIAGSGLWAVARWMPYSYAFINPIAGWNQEGRSWELDYWGVTALEGVEKLQMQGLDTVTVEPTLMTSDFAGAVWPDQARSDAPEGYGLYLFHRGDNTIGTCRSLFTIKRDRQVLGEGAVCTKWDG